MRVCPHCDSEIPEDHKTCPSCRALYWNADSSPQDVGKEEEEENEGCFSIFAVHFFVAFAFFVLLLVIGFIINLLVHFEQNQIKVIWIGVALLLAAAISGIIAKLRQNKEKRDSNQK